MFDSKFIRMFASLVIVGLIYGCATSPTGRSQLRGEPDGSMNKMGEDAFEELKQKTPIEHNPSINAYVKCIALAVAHEATDTTGVKDWEIVVFKDNSANAFALPGGKIGVHTGILPVAKTSGQLAAVLGHEVGHVIARHGNERVSQEKAKNFGIAVASRLVKSNLLLTGLSMGTQILVLLPFSRTHESEADVIGLDLSARAGFDPREAVQLWKNMGAGGGKGPPQFLSTHPSHETRISDLESNMGSAIDKYNQARANGKNPNCRI